MAVAIITPRPVLPWRRRAGAGGSLIVAAAAPVCFYMYSSFKHLRVVLFAQEISKVFVEGDLLTMDIAGAAESIERRWARSGSSRF